MSYSYDTRKKPAGKAGMTDAAAPAEAVQTNMTPTAADKGSRVDLPDAMRAKMENAFGADLSAVKLYESRAVADAGAEAVTRGSEIAFAPGKFDLASAGGQALLGHELSHVVSQQRGEVTGSGFLNDHALEARADREGVMAAAGQQVYAGPVTGAMSAAAPAVAAAAPMQAARKKDKDAARANADMAMMRRGGAEEAAEHAAFVKKHVYGNRIIWTLAAANFFVYVVRFACLDWGPTILTENKGLSMASATTVMLFFELVGGNLGMLFWGWATDHIFHSKITP